VEIGVPVESSFEGIAPRSTRPVVVYGTSIVHGAYATRSGMIYTAHLSRRIDRPFINLGFSGSARMEPEIADLLLELDPEVYLLDAFPNMNLERVEERLEAFLRKLAAGKPDVPIVVVEDFPRTNAWIMPEKEGVGKKNERVREIVKGLEAEGLKLFTVKGDDLLGSDHEGTMDGIHPNDLGYYRMFEKILPVVQEALNARNP
jgi:lysophospholipase L1-like esterase